MYIICIVNSTCIYHIYHFIIFLHITLCFIFILIWKMSVRVLFFLPLYSYLILDKRNIFLKLFLEVYGPLHQGCLICWHSKSGVLHSALPLFSLPHFHQSYRHLELYLYWKGLLSTQTLCKGKFAMWNEPVGEICKKLVKFCSWVSFLNWEKMPRCIKKLIFWIKCIEK